jgi:hypothetical protein
MELNGIQKWINNIPTSALNVKEAGAHQIIDFQQTNAYSALMRYVTPLLFSLLFLISCDSGRRPSGVMDEERFVTVYCDLLQQSLRSRNTRADPSTAAANAQAILDSAGVSRDSYQATYRWYNEDVTRWKAFWEEVTKELERRETIPPLRR